jgi:hypothetical protein
MEPLARPPIATGQTAIPKVFGILSIIFAALVLLFGLFAAAAGLVPLVLGSVVSAAGKPELSEAPMLAAIKAVYGGIGVIGVIQVGMSALLLAIGIGQLRYRLWARDWSVNWGAAALVAVFVMVYVSMRVVGPGYTRLFEVAATKQPGQGSPPDLGALSSLFGGIWAGMFVFLYTPYPVLLLAFFTRPRVKDAMIF